MYEKFIIELKSYSKAIRILSKQYLPITLMPPSKLEAILKQVKIALSKTNKDYDLVLTRLYLYYDMKTSLTLYQIETVPVPVLDTNYQTQSYKQLKINKPYIALNEETYISLCPQELNTCKRIGYEYFCEELFVVKSKNRYSCASTIYFNLRSELLKKTMSLIFISIKLM